MDSVNIFIAGKQIANDVAFQRAPIVGELMQLKDGWYKVDKVGHAWTSSGPILLVDVVKGHTTEGHTAEAGEALFPDFPAAHAPVSGE